MMLSCGTDTRSGVGEGTLRHPSPHAEQIGDSAVPRSPAGSAPEEQGVIALVEENCTVCMLCARECPDWCIYIDSHKETLPAPEGAAPAPETCSTASRSTSPSACTAGSASRSARSTRCSGPRSSSTPRATSVTSFTRRTSWPPGTPSRRPRPTSQAPIRRRNWRPPPARSAPVPHLPPRLLRLPARCARPARPARCARCVRHVRRPGSPRGAARAARSAPGRPSRPGPSAGHASVRAIRPPGALPKKDAPSTGESSAEKLSTGRGDVPPEAAPPEQTSPTDPSGEPEEEK